MQKRYKKFGTSFIICIYSNDIEMIEQYTCTFSSGDERQDQSGEEQIHQGMKDKINQGKSKYIRGLVN
jgi:hypothetical protein